VSNRFCYRVSFAALDVDEIPALAARLALFSHNRPNLYSLYDRDYGQTDDGGLRHSIESFAEEQGIALGLGRIVLVTQLRAVGWVFNPVSFFFCYGDRTEGDLVCAVAEVNNTYGQRHRYLLDRRNQRSGAGARYRTPKALYVSPFLGDQGDYHWDLRTAREPAMPERHDLRVRLHQRGRVALAAQLTGTRRELSDLALLKLLWSHPLMPQQIIGRIHWQALKLRAAGLQYRSPAIHDAPSFSADDRSPRRARRAQDDLAPWPAGARNPRR
jgi:DUF1365 family protein